MSGAADLETHRAFFASLPSALKTHLPSVTLKAGKQKTGAVLVVFRLMPSQSILNCAGCIVTWNCSVLGRSLYANPWSIRGA